MPYLDFEGDTRELLPGETVVGSGNQSSWRLQNVDLAARHAVFEIGPGGEATVRPFTASVLLTVNGTRVERPVRLRQGDVIGAGSTSFVYIDTPAAPHTRPSPVEAHLIDEAGGVAYALQRKAVHIGRDAGSTIQVKDPAVSRYHADVRTEAGLHVLYSMGAAGTRVNGSPIAETRILTDGDIIEIGELRLRYARGPAPVGLRVSTGGEEYDLDVSRLPTGRSGKFEPPSIEKLQHPKILRGVAIIVALLAAAAVWLIMSL